MPYDTAMFYTRNMTDLKRTFGPSPRLGTPAYLQVHAPSSTTSPPSATTVHDHQVPDNDALALRVWHAGLPSPLDCGIENSRRFRALPLYAGLMEQGRDGYTGAFFLLSPASPLRTFFASTASVGSLTRVHCRGDRYRGAQLRVCIEDCSVD